MKMKTKMKKKMKMYIVRVHTEHRKKRTIIAAQNVVYFQLEERTSIMMGSGMCTYAYATHKINRNES